MHTVLAIYNGVNDRILDLQLQQEYISGEDGEPVTEWIAPTDIKAVNQAEVTIGNPLVLPDSITTNGIKEVNRIRFDP